MKITPLNRSRWIRGMARSAAKRIRDQANLMVAASGPEMKTDTQLFDIIERNAIVSLIYARELRRRHPEPSPRQLELSAPFSNIP